MVRKLPMAYAPAPKLVTGRVVAAIVIEPRSRGTISIPYEHYVNGQLPRHRYISTSSDGVGSPHVSFEPLASGASYEVTNTRDSISLAKLELLDDGPQAPAAG